MKLVKNCIKQCKFCMDYQSILSDVDKHQRTCASNPNKEMTLNIDDNFDENKFLNNFSNNNLSQIVGNNEDDIQSVRASYNKSAAVKGLKSKQLETIDLNKLALDRGELEEQKQTISRSKTSTKNNDAPPKIKAKDTDTDMMVLPHLHKHDLYKRMTYDKPSTWI
jgi:hypothetical protein